MVAMRDQLADLFKGKEQGTLLGGTGVDHRGWSGEYESTKFQLSVATTVPNFSKA
jgi:hypothetical protein